MKRHITLLSIIAGILSSAHATVVSIPVENGTWAWSERVFDIDNDGITDFNFRGTFYCTADEPTSSCSFDLTLQAKKGFEYLLNSTLHGNAMPLAEGDILGPDASPGMWSVTGFFLLNVSSSIPIQDPVPTNSEYQEGGKRYAYSIGFRQKMDAGDFRYGWIDVSLLRFSYSLSGLAPTSKIIPDISAIHFSDSPGESVTVRPIPEPSQFAFLALSPLALLHRKRKTNFGS